MTVLLRIFRTHGLPFKRAEQETLKVGQKLQRTKTSPQNVIKCLFKKGCAHTINTYLFSLVYNIPSPLPQPSYHRGSIIICLNSPLFTIPQKKNTSKKKSDKYKVPIIHFLRKRHPKKEAYKKRTLEKERVKKLQWCNKKIRRIRSKLLETRVLLLETSKEPSSYTYIFIQSAQAKCL